MSTARSTAAAGTEPESFPEFDQEITEKILNLGLYDNVYYPAIPKTRTRGRATVGPSMPLSNAASPPEDDFRSLMVQAIKLADTLQHRLSTPIIYDDDTLVSNHETMATSRMAADLVQFTASATSSFQHTGYGATDLEDLLSKEEVSWEVWLDIGEIAAVALELFQMAQRRLATVAMNLSICGRTARKVAALEASFLVDMEAASTSEERKTVENLSFREFKRIMISWCQSGLSMDGMVYLAE